MSERGSAQIGVTGLAVMGRNLARNLARHGHTVALHNRSPERTRSLVEQHGDEGTFVASESMPEFVASLAQPRAVIVMVKAGGPTDAVIDELVPLLDEGDIVIDCGNAHFADTRRREAALKEHGLHFVGCGRLRRRGGRPERPEHHAGRIRAVLPDARPDVRVDRRAGRRHAVLRARRPRRRGPLRQDGAQRHRVRRHAADRRGLRPAPAGLGASPAEIAKIFRTWNEGDLDSFLIEITAEVLCTPTPATGQPFVDVVLDEAEQKGTGRWTVQSALDLGVPITGIAEATFARALSGHADQRAAARAAFGGGAAGFDVADRDAFVEDVRRALYASKVVAYAQGFDHIEAGSAEYGWDIDRGAMATIWRGGCIIRARFLDRIREAYDEDPALPSLLVAPYFVDALRDGVDSWRRVVAQAATAGIPTPAFSSSLAYYDGLRRDRLPAALIQGLRDNFGAHTYRRVDRDGNFHTEWAGDKAESPGRDRPRGARGAGTPQRAGRGGGKGEKGEKGGEKGARPWAAPRGRRTPCAWPRAACRRRAPLDGC